MRWFDHELLAGRSLAYLGLHVEATQDSVDDVRQVAVHSQDVAFTYFDEGVKRRSSLAFENALLRSTALCFLITQRDSLYASEQVDESWVGDEVAQIVTMCCSNEFDTALSDRAACLCLFD